MAIQSAYAQRVQPMVFELEPLGKGSTESIRLENNKQRPITVEMNASKIVLDEFGKETNIPADEDFLIYPPQTIVQPGKTQIIKVRYVGEPRIEKSQAYRVSVKQLPVDLESDAASGVGIVFNFRTLVNVTPTGAKPELSVIDISQDDESNWALTIQNTGNRFSRLSQTSWIVTSTQDSSITKSFTKLEVAGMVSRTLVEPKSSLTLTIPKIEGFEPGSSSITITDES